jgi:hypothetical protein
MLKNINFIKTNPFYIFEVENFLDKNLYEGLKLNFPKIYNTNNNLDVFKNGKFGFDTSSLLYQSTLNTNQYVKRLHDVVYSEDFFKFFYSKLYFKFLLSRKSNIKHILKLLRKPKLVDKINKSSLKYYLNFKTEMKIEIQYSFIENGGKIVPHTDSGEKLLSLMLYFPDYENDNTNIKYLESSYGTSFWKSKKENFNNKHQEGDSEKLFINDKSNKIIYKSKFEGNKLLGFIKNPYSWHSVDPVNISSNYIRKSININFYF